jgi:hypothetical protein
MPSPAEDCWRLSADCTHWAAESRDNAARLAFRQMATAWAGLAFSQDFVFPTDEQVGATSSENSETAAVENTGSSNVENEQIGAIRNAEIDVERHDQTTSAGTNNSGQLEKPAAEHRPSKTDAVDGASRIGQATGRGPTDRPDSQSSLNEPPVPNVDWLALWDEFAQATDNKQLEVAERIVYHDRRWDFTGLSRSRLIAAARQIIRERVQGTTDPLE